MTLNIWDVLAVVWFQEILLYLNRMQWTIGFNFDMFSRVDISLKTMIGRQKRNIPATRSYEYIFTICMWFIALAESQTLVYKRAINNIFSRPNYFHIFTTMIITIRFWHVGPWEMTWNLGDSGDYETYTPFFFPPTRRTHNHYLHMYTCIV